MYFHRWDFHKAQPNGRTSLQTTLGIANTCISEKWASWFSEASSPTAADSNCRAGRSSWPTWRNGQGPGGSAGFSWLRAPYPPGKPGAPKTSYMFFSSNTGKNSFLKSFPNPLVSPMNHPGWRWTSTTRWGLHARLPWQPWLWLQGVTERNVFCRIFLFERINILWLKQFLLENTHTPPTENTDKSPHNNAYFKPADCCIMQLPY